VIPDNPGLNGDAKEQIKLELKARINRADARTIRHAPDQLSAKGSVTAAGANDVSWHPDIAARSTNMTLDDFRRSLTATEPPAELTLALAGLWWDAKGDWTRAA
jgi:hypothetical protein